jgi:hypothetical protein
MLYDCPSLDDGAPSRRSVPCNKKEKVDLGHRNFEFSGEKGNVPPKMLGK